MRKLLLIFGAVLLLFSCYHENKEEISEPDPLFTPQQMVNIMTDIQIAEAVIARNRIDRNVLEKSYKDSVFRVVYDHYGITRQQLLDNINYYNSKPRQMEKIYDKVLSNLSRMKSEVDVKMKKEEMEEEEQ